MLLNPQMNMRPRSLVPDSKRLDRGRNGGEPSRALITGGLGFIGSQLCEVLVAGGSRVAVVDDLSVGSRGNLASSLLQHVSVFEVDIRDVSSLQESVRSFRPTIVFHLAAVHFIPTCETQPTLAVSVNVGGTQAVLETVAREENVEAIVIASSGAIYRPKMSAHRESDPIGPTDIYGHTKEWTEKLAGYFHAATGVPVGIARIFNVIGPGETNPHLLPEIINQVLTGDELRLGNLTTKRDYVFVGDVAKGLTALAVAVPTHGLLTCNLGAERAVSGAELVQIVIDSVGHDVVRTSDRARFRASDRPVLVSDCSHAHQLLGWRAETSVTDAVAAALAQQQSKRGHRASSNQTAFDQAAGL